MYPPCLQWILRGRIHTCETGYSTVNHISDCKSPANMVALLEYNIIIFEEHIDGTLNAQSLKDELGKQLF